MKEDKYFETQSHGDHRARKRNYSLRPPCLCVTIPDCYTPRGYRRTQRKPFPSRYAEG